MIFLKYNFVKQNGKFYIKNENIVLGYIEFFEKNNIISINKVVVEESFRGQGIANKLMEQIVNIADEKNKKINPVCSFAVSWFEKNKNFSHVLVKFNNFSR